MSVEVWNRALGLRAEVCGIAFRWDLGDSETLGLQSFERLVIRSTSKCRRQILEGESCCLLALQEGDEVPLRKSLLPPCRCAALDPRFLYTANRVT